jgi:co-chaperonin GroES (HSP10)
MKFRPLHDRVVIERVDAEAKSAGGIIIPDTAKEKPQQGKVIAVGPGDRDESGKLIPIGVKVGDQDRSVFTRDGSVASWSDGSITHKTSSASFNSLAC